MARKIRKQKPYSESWRTSGENFSVYIMLRALFGGPIFCALGAAARLQIRSRGACLLPRIAHKGPADVHKARKAGQTGEDTTKRFRRPGEATQGPCRRRGRLSPCLTSSGAPPADPEERGRSCRGSGEPAGLPWIRSGEDVPREGPGRPLQLSGRVRCGECLPSCLGGLQGGGEGLQACPDVSIYLLF